jgi:hypothetical protein
VRSHTLSADFFIFFLDSYGLVLLPWKPIGAA